MEYLIWVDYGRSKEPAVQILFRAYIWTDFLNTLKSYLAEGYEIMDGKIEDDKVVSVTISPSNSTKGDK